MWELASSLAIRRQVTSKLRRARTLQTIGDFVAYLNTFLAHPSGLQSTAEELKGTWDFKTFFLHLGINVAGLVSTHHQPHATHSWRLVHRKDLSLYLKDGDQVLQTPRVGKGFKCWPWGFGRSGHGATGWCGEPLGGGVWSLRGWMASEVGHGLGCAGRWQAWFLLALSKSSIYLYLMS